MFVSDRSLNNKNRCLALAPAKINLCLEVLGKRADGYHEISTLMGTINLYDVLEFEKLESPEIEVVCNRPELSSGKDNLVYRAALKLQEKLKEKDVKVPGVKIYLQKNIPWGAGLGGGSSDAATTLACLNQLWSIDLDKRSLMQIGSELGSDIPFFFEGPLAWCTGRGEKVETFSIKESLTYAPLYLVLITINEHLSTKMVYEQLHTMENSAEKKENQSGKESKSIDRKLGKVDNSQNQKSERIERMINALETNRYEHIIENLHNDLQLAAMELCPTIKKWMNCLKEIQAKGVLMTGSGSSIYTLCKDYLEAQRIVFALQALPKNQKQDVEFLILQLSDPFATEIKECNCGYLRS